MILSKTLDSEKGVWLPGNAAEAEALMFLGLSPNLSEEKAAAVALLAMGLPNSHLSKGTPRPKNQLLLPEVDFVAIGDKCTFTLSWKKDDFVQVNPEDSVEEE